MPCLPHPSGCAAPKSPLAAVLIQVSFPGLLHQQHTPLLFSIVAPSRKMVSWPLPPVSPRCEGDEAVGRGGPLWQEGSREQQPMAAWRCQQHVRDLSGEAAHTGGCGRRSRALSGPTLVLFPSMLLLTASFSLPAELLSPS